MPSSAFSKKQLTFILGAVLIIATLAVFWPVRDCDFINYDDGDYVTENNRVQAGLTADNIKWAFSAKFASNWHPLTWLSHMADAQMFGLNPRGHHFTSLLLHAANVLFLFLVFNRMTGALWRSAIVAAFFALHPLRVESVAWVSERKDVLSGFFFMLTLMAWTSYAEKVKSRKPAMLWYAAALACFALGLMSKPMLVTVPAVLLLIDVWPLRRMQTAPIATKGKQAEAPQPSFDFSKLPGLLTEKIPFAALALISSGLTVQAQKAGGSVRSLEEFPLSLRLDNALLACLRYMRKMIWPNDLAIFYPHEKSFPAWQVLGALAVLAVITFVVIRWARKKPVLTIGWFWFLIMLVPVIGIVQVGIQSMADRYTYLPMIGLYALVVWGAAELLSNWKPHPQVLGAAAAAGLVACTVATRQYLAAWHNSETLFGHALKVTTNNYVAHENLGIALANAERLQESEEHLRIARDTHPTYAEAHHNLGNTLHRLGRDDEAIPCYKEAIRLKPDYDAAYNNWGFICAKQGRFEEARKLYFEAARLTPNDPVVHYNLGAAFVQLNNVAEAIKEYLRSIELNPSMPQAHFQLAGVFAGIGKKAEAISHLQEALRLKPDYTEARDQLNSLSR